MTWALLIWLLLYVFFIPTLQNVCSNFYLARFTYGPVTGDWCQHGSRAGRAGLLQETKNRAVFLARRNYISIMQMSLVSTVKGLLECVIENAKDCLASKCRGMRRLDANQNGGGPRVPRARWITASISLELNRFILINCAESVQVCKGANFFHPSFSLFPPLCVKSKWKKFFLPL